MDDRWMTVEELVAAVRNEAALTPGDIERWHKLDLLPRPQRERLKEGRGFRSLGYPPGTLGQLRALLRIRQDTDDTNTGRVLLWLAGFPIPPQKVKESLCAALRHGFSP